MKTTRNDEEGYFEYSGIGRVYDDGKVQVFGRDGDGDTIIDPDTFYRDEDDYDTGDSYRKPGMPYVQLRRSRKEVIFARSMSVIQLAMLAWLVIGYPVTFGFRDGTSSALAVLFAALGLYLVWDLFRKKKSRFATEENGRGATSLFDFQWHGRI